MDLAHQVLQQLLLPLQVVNSAVMLHQQLLQQLPQTLAVVQLLQLQAAVQLLLQLQVDVGCWQNQSWSEESVVHRPE